MTPGQTLFVNKKSLLAIDGHNLCEIGRNKPLRLRLARPCRSNGLDRSGGRPLGRSQFSKKEWSMAQSRESTNSEQSRSGASGSSGSGTSGEQARGGSEGAGSGSGGSGGASMSG